MIIKYGLFDILIIQKVENVLIKELGFSSLHLHIKYNKSFQANGNLTELMT